MGAGKLPEQIGERAYEAALDAEHQTHPSIEQSRALPSDSATRHKTEKFIVGMTPKMKRERTNIAMEMGVEAKLRYLYGYIDRLRIRLADTPTDVELQAEISALRKKARALRQKFPRQSKGKKRRRRGL